MIFIFQYFELEKTSALFVLRIYKLEGKMVILNLVSPKTPHHATVPFVTGMLLLVQTAIRLDLRLIDMKTWTIEKKIAPLFIEPIKNFMMYPHQLPINIIQSQ